MHILKLQIYAKIIIKYARHAGYVFVKQKVTLS